MKKEILVLIAAIISILLISAVRASTIGRDAPGLYLIFTGPREEVLTTNQELQGEGFVLVDNRFTPQNIQVTAEGDVIIDGKSLIEIANGVSSPNSKFDLLLFNEIIAESRLHGLTIVTPITIDHRIESKITGGRIRYPAGNTGYLGQMIDDFPRSNIRVSNAEYIEFRFNREIQESTVAIHFGRNVGYFYIASDKMAEAFSPQNIEIIYASRNPSINFSQGGSTQTLVFKDIEYARDSTNYYFVPDNLVMVTGNWADKTTTIAGRRFKYGENINSLIPISSDAIASVELDYYGMRRISAVFPDGTEYKIDVAQNNLNLPIHQLSNLGKYADKNQLSANILSFPFFNLPYTIQNFPATIEVSSENKNVRMVIPKDSPTAETLITQGYV